MLFRRYLCLVALAAAAVLAFGATAASSRPAASGKPSPTSTPVAKVGIKYTVTKFVRRGHRLVAYGTAISRYIPTSGGATTTSRRAFRASVAVSARRLAANSTIF